MPGAIVVGAGPGVGTSVAQRLAREGLTVGVIARTEATVDDALSALSDYDALGVTADVTDEVGLRAALDEIVDRFGIPELLVYNAALIQSDSLGELTAQQHLDAWAVNVVGAITAATHLAPQMMRHGTGTIIITGGMPEPLPEATSLSLGKAGVRALAQLLAAAYGPAGLHVATVTIAGAVAPGTGFDPDDIAEHYWRLHAQPPEAWEHEVIHTGVRRRSGSSGASRGSPPSDTDESTSRVRRQADATVRVLLISGSSRDGSTNTAVLRTAAALAPAEIDTVLLDGLGDLPLFNPDDDAEGVAVASRRGRDASPSRPCRRDPDLHARVRRRTPGGDEERARVDDRRRRHVRKAGGLDQCIRGGRTDRRRRRARVAGQGTRLRRRRNRARRLRPNTDQPKHDRHGRA